ncbi:hypothetical protein V8G54_030988 [Vigna mungo]|uniref:Uncharacterized protein n=1 Tax=Vigna mungo TaxID=3915 RepID=A0AAQ3MWS2_VIGMU
MIKGLILHWMFFINKLFRHFQNSFVEGKQTKRVPCFIPIHHNLMIRGLYSVIAPSHESIASHDNKGICRREIDMNPDTIPCLHHECIDMILVKNCGEALVSVSHKTQLRLNLFWCCVCQKPKEITCRPHV